MNYNKKTIRDIDLKGKKVLLRCDFNVPMNKETGEITDTRRIEAALETIRYLKEQDCKIILCSHLGKPKGEFNQKLSLGPVAKKLEELLGEAIIMGTYDEEKKSIINPKVKEQAENLKPGEIMLLENTRFNREETDNDPEFSKELIELAGEDGIFVNDAFGAAHRAHASTAGVANAQIGNPPHKVPAVSGFLMEKELKILGDALENPERPFVAILGGSKVSDKILVIDSLIEKAGNGGKVLIGGGMAFTFLKALGKEVGNSLCELDKCDLALELIEKAKQTGVKFVLPVDTVVGREFTTDTETKIVDCDNIEQGWGGYDIGPKTIQMFSDELQDAKTIIWNGPLGAFEIEKFANGTNGIAKALSELDGVTTIIGGGDSAAAVEKAGLSDKMTHISTGGGASLEFIEGKNLPGVACLDDSVKNL